MIDTMSLRTDPRTPTPPLAERLAELIAAVREWPWYETVRTLARRFSDDRLGLTAGSLTFTTLLALVPLATVMLALFAAFPMFAGFQAALERFFVQSLVPETIAGPVMQALTDFASKANRLGTAGLLVLLATAVALLLTIDRTLNNIWRVRQPRPIAQRVLVYWAALTLGPLVLGVSLSATSYALTASRGMAAVLPGGVGLLLSVLEWALVAVAMAGLFHYVPNTHVRWRHAWAGGIFVALGIEAAKQGLSWYMQAFPSYSVMYGAFATVPILLLWVYLVWVIVLWGAVIAAYAPSLQMRLVRRASTPGHRFELALLLLRELVASHRGPERGLTTTQLALALRLDPLQIEPVLDELLALDWVARLEEPGEGRWALLAEPTQTRAQPLVERLLLAPSPITVGFTGGAGLKSLTLAQLLGIEAPDSAC
jgi:membrane protein